MLSVGFFDTFLGHGTVFGDRVYCLPSVYYCNYRDLCV